MKTIFDPKRHLPVGWDWENLRFAIRWGQGLCLLSMLSFLDRYFDARGSLYSYTQLLSGEMVKELVPGRMIRPFWDLMAGLPYMGLWWFAVQMIWQIIRHYQYHTKDAMPIYLMRRLPDRWELHRRCLTVPLLAMVFEVVLFGLATVLCWLLWRFATPEGHLPM